MGVRCVVVRYKPACQEMLLCHKVHCLSVEVTTSQHARSCCCARRYGNCVVICIVGGAEPAESRHEPTSPCVSHMQQQKWWQIAEC